MQELPEDPRLDKAIPLHIKSISRTQARNLIEGGSVYLNTKRCRQNSAVVSVGDKIKILDQEQERTTEETLLRKSDILFENKDWIVVNKPPNLPSHETIDSARNHLVLSIKNFLGARDRVNPSLVYLGVHHRLDRDTSGAILFAKTKEANAPIAQAFQNREVHKTYLCVCVGVLDKKEFVIKNFLGTHPRNKRMQAVLKKGGKIAETDFQVLEERQSSEGKISLVVASPKTGRTHQIRVHLSHFGHPILGDTTYGKASKMTARTLLHAWKLQILGKEFTAPVPEDFKAVGFHEF